MPPPPPSGEPASVIALTAGNPGITTNLPTLHAGISYPGISVYLPTLSPRISYPRVTAYKSTLHPRIAVSVHLTLG